MKCMYCGSNMKCVNDVNDISVRIDWYECTECDGKCEIIYNTIDSKPINRTWTHKLIEKLD